MRIGASRILTGLTLSLSLLATPAAAQGLFEEAIGGDAVQEAPSEEAAATESDSTETTGGARPATGNETSVLGDVLRSKLELNGYVRGDMFVGKATGADATQIKAGYGEAALKLRARAGAWGDAYGEARFKTGLEWGEPVTAAELREAYVNLYLGPLDLRFGHQVIVWGRADGFNPTDNLTPRDMNVRSADPDDRRLANLAARAWLNVAPLRIELVWVPFFASSRFPRFELPGPLALGAVDTPDQNLTKGIGAVRLNFEGAAFEGSVSYLIGHATFPGIGLESVGLSPAGLAITAGFTSYRWQVIGVDFATAVGDWFGLRGEAALRYPFDYAMRPDVPRPDVQWVLGVDRELFGSLSIIAQYLGRYVIDWTPIQSSGLLSGGAPPAPSQLPPLPVLEGLIRDELRLRKRAIYNQGQEHSHAASLRLAWTTLQDTLTLEVLAFVDFTYEAYLIQPKATYAITDALSVVAGGEIYGGSDAALFGLVEETLSAGFVELKMSF